MNKEPKGDSSLHLLKDILQKCSTLALNTSLSGYLSGENHRERIERKNTQAPHGKTEGRRNERPKLSAIVGDLAILQAKTRKNKLSPG